MRGMKCFGILRVFGGKVRGAARKGVMTTNRFRLNYCERCERSSALRLAIKIGTPKSTCSAIQLPFHIDALPN